MTIKDGFKFGIGLILAQLVLGILTLTLSLTVLYLIGSNVKAKAAEVLLNSAMQSGESK